MFNLGDDNELDRASREAAGKYAAPGDPDWQALSAELDKVLPVEKRKRRILFYWWLLPVLLIGGAAVYWLVQNDNAPMVPIQQPVISRAGKIEDKALSSAGPLVKTQKENTKPATDIPETQIQTVRINKQTDIKIAAKTGERTGATGGGSLAISSHKTVSVPVKEQPAANRDVAGTMDQLVKEPPVTTPVSKSIIDPAKETAKNNPDQPSQPVKENSVPVKEEKVEPTPENFQPLPELKSSATTPKLPQQRGKGFSFGILAGIDKSTVKFKHTEDAGVNIGFLAGYHFSDRWSMHTGLIYTQKNYKVDGPDFTAPKGSWASYYKIDNVEGYCRMWELPLLARYTVSQSARHSVFLSTGLSSYFMTSENYDYTYYTNTGQLAMRNSAYNSSDAHILSILHLSAGLENRISKSLSLQIEPYAKIPLGGVGFGNIRLSSFGLNFSVQHRQPSKK